ncbi:hypothetical protein [Allokutzneria albata]|uniref:hypothetical protein n=1 Tax=Allokutzneria albata TaxID=211114 RepID=UPI0012DC109D|nr:hypothetical protein [Allokutzneria albata]
MADQLIARPAAPGGPLPPGLKPPGQLEQRGELEIAREPYTGTLCEHTIVLADRNRVVVQVRRPKRGSTNLCALAEVVSGHAVSVLERDEGIPRRAVPFPPNSLATLNACGLLDAEALKRVPGVDPNRPDTAFGDWERRWCTPTAGVSVIFDRAAPRGVLQTGRRRGRGHLRGPRAASRVREAHRAGEHPRQRRPAARPALRDRRRPGRGGHREAAAYGYMTNQIAT